MSFEIKEIDNGNNVVFKFPDSINEISADGVAPSLTGFPFTKLNLYREQISSDKTTITREIVATINIPTAALLEFVLGNKETLKSNLDKIDASVNHFKALVNSER